MRFALAAVVFMYVGRKLGWAMSRKVLYRVSIPVSLLIGAIWGIAVGYSMSALRGWLHPNAILKWVLGFALAAYVAMPTFGLFPYRLPDDYEELRDSMLYVIPIVAYAVTEFATASLRVG